MRPTGLTSDGPLSKTVDLSTSDQVADFTLRAVAGVSAAGTVRDPDGNPVPGVTVTLHDPNTGATTTQISDGDGNYLFDPVAAGTGWSVTATAPDGTTVSGPRTFDVPVDSETPIRNLDFVVTPNPTGSVSGTVTQRGNGPLTGIPVEVTGPGGITYRPITDGDGNWSLEDLPPGNYSALVEPPAGMTVDTKDPLQFTIPPDRRQHHGSGLRARHPGASHPLGERRRHRRHRYADSGCRGDSDRSDGRQQEDGDHRRRRHVDRRSVDPGDRLHGHGHGA